MSRFHFSENGWLIDEKGDFFFPFGRFGNYFRGYHIDEVPAYSITHGNDLLEFQNCPVSIWHKWFSFLKQEGITALRMFPRGRSINGYWEGLDALGRVNTGLLEIILNYIKTGGEYGIKFQLCLFTQPECSVYCSSMTRKLFGIPHFTKDDLSKLPDYQKKFLIDPEYEIPYREHFTDKDTLECHMLFLNELIPLLKNEKNIFALEIYNEMGWAGPHGKSPLNLNWEETSNFITWTASISDRIKKIDKDILLCISHPGFGFIGHDPIFWSSKVNCDFYSSHTYAGLSGYCPGVDYALITDITNKYAVAGKPAMCGEWESINLPSDEKNLKLALRDTLWFSVLSGCPGMITWCDRGYRENILLQNILSKLPIVSFKRRSAVLGIDIRQEYEFYNKLVNEPSKICMMDEKSWCPDRVNETGHRYCVKYTSQYTRNIFEWGLFALEKGIDYEFTLEPEKYKHSLNLRDFDKATPELLEHMPLTVSSGYHIKYMISENEDRAIFYLRNYNNFETTYKTERFSLRNQVAKELDICFNLKKEYKFEIYDLDEQQTVFIGSAQKNSTVTLGKTTSDYVIICTIQS